MSGGHRLAAGGRIDRTRPLSFSFDGRPYTGFAGDTLASALIANGVGIVARSFKYHRPRGIMTAGPEEPNALVQLGAGGRSEPNSKATEVELTSGLVARSVNAWPSARLDLGAAGQLAGGLLVAGFYYKTFKWPKFLWDAVYEPVIRRMAGWGEAPREPDPDTYEKRYAHCDVLVAGSGPSGLAAALAAGRTGARVILADEQVEPGGWLLAGQDRIAGGTGLDWAAGVLAELRGMAEVRVLPRCTVFGYYDHNYLMMLERVPGLGPRLRLWHVRAKRVVLATGAHERPLVFPGNDRPGVMLAGAVRSYLNRYGVAPGTRAVVVTNNDGAYRAALALAEAGVGIAAVADLRAAAPDRWRTPLERLGIPVLPGSAVIATHGRELGAVDIVPLAGGKPWRVECDLLAVSGGWNPAVHLFCQSQGRLRWDDDIAAFVPHRAAQAQRSAGAARGTFSLAGAIAEGLAAGAREAQAAGFGDGAAPPAPPLDEPGETRLRPYWLVRAGAQDRGEKSFVDVQNDATAADILLAAREGMHSVEHMKRWTTAGLGTDQGKTGNVNALALLSEALGRPIPETGTTTFRPPYTPVTFGALAGRDRAEMSDPVRVTPMHDWHVAHGAVFEDVGQWKRPRYYAFGGEDMSGSLDRECRAVRGAVGVLDASTLGKIEIEGPDAAVLLDRVYTNAWSKLPVGSCRYGVMCREDGMVFDDGVTSRLAERRYLMTTTTGNAAAVLDWLDEWLQTEWPELRVHCTSVTEQWATVSIAGPRARELMSVLAPEMKLGRDEFPFMTWREGRVGGIPARIFRISFTGELSYEVNVAATEGLALWTKVMAAGEAFGIAPYGTEGMHLLRAEKGFIIVGQETDGTVTPQDLGMDWIVSKTKDFIGRRSQARADLKRADRKQLVGLLPDDPDVVLPEGAQLVDALTPYYPVPMIGHVTSSYRSPALGRAFALALVKGGRARHGQRLLAPLADTTIAARIVDPVFYDREGHRRDG
jgi:sarcosine oxidase subunit alpha